MKDYYQRTINTLRLSITDNCNLSCIYCQPKHLLTHISFMDIETIEHIFKVCKELQINKLKITGGEPLLHPNINEILKLSQQYFIETSITTNGILLTEDLLKYNINHYNISLDSLNCIKYQQITGLDYLNIVINNIKMLINNNQKVKINVVLMKNINEVEINDFINLAIQYPIEVRFIELMPITNLDYNNFLSCDYILEQYPNLKYINTTRTAKLYKIENMIGTIGLIYSTSKNICKNCDKIRITSDNKIKSCLYSDLSFDFTIKNIKEQMIKAILNKPIYKNETNKIKDFMNTIGG